MRHLTLIRHAKSDWSVAGQPDWQRPLNARGLRDAPDMGRRLRQRKLKPDRFLTSPATRALTTAQLLARELHYAADGLLIEDRLYHAAPNVILQVIRERGANAHHLLLVGHNPGITEFADQLSGDRHIDHMPTCAVVTLAVDVRTWADLEWQSGLDVTFDYPKNPSDPG